MEKRIAENHSPKILLSSAGFTNKAVENAFLSLLPVPADQAAVLFIPTAAVTEEALFYVEESRSELAEAGIHSSNIIGYNLDRPMRSTNYVNFPPYTSAQGIPATC